jgi:hypothetical protein
MYSKLLRHAARSLLGLALLFHAHDSRACGVPPPGSPPGFHCGDTEQSAPPRFRTSFSYLFSSTRLVFTGDKKADVERQIAGSGIEYRPNDRWSAQLSFGVLTRGRMRFIETSHTLVSGLSLSLSASYQLLPERPSGFFAGLTGTVGYANAKTSEFTPIAGASAGAELRGASIAYNAFDARLGLTAGKTFADVVALYATARVFGGPVFWKLRNEQVLGTDIYKYQVGAGASFSPFRNVDVFVEGIAFGERALALGAGVSY